MTVDVRGKICYKNWSLYQNSVRILCRNVKSLINRLHWQKNILMCLFFNCLQTLKYLLCIMCPKVVDDAITFHDTDAHKHVHKRYIIFAILTFSNGQNHRNLNKWFLSHYYTFMLHNVKTLMQFSEHSIKHIDLN